VTRAKQAFNNSDLAEKGRSNAAPTRFCGGVNLALGPGRLGGGLSWHAEPFTLTLRASRKTKTGAMIDGLSSLF